MAPSPRPARSSPARDEACRAAVLVLIYPQAGEPTIVLTLRTAKVATHRLQMSLPGGRTEDNESIEQTALRETQEELGVAPQSVQVLGRLTPLLVRASNHLIHPVVGCVSEQPIFVRNKAEVECVIEVGLHELAGPGVLKKEIWSIDGWQREVPFFLLRGHKVWGATAMILSEFVEVVRLVDSFPSFA